MTDDLVTRLRHFADKYYLLGEEAERIKALEKNRVKKLQETMWEFEAFITKLEMLVVSQAQRDIAMLNADIAELGGTK